MLLRKNFYFNTKIANKSFVKGIEFLPQTQKKIVKSFDFKLKLFDLIELVV